MPVRLARPTLGLLPLEDRITPAGQLDPTFGSGGTTTVAFPGAALGVVGRAAVQDSAGRLLVVGDQDNQLFAVARLTPTGALDPTFDGDGRKTIDLGGLGLTTAVAQAVAVQGDGKIVVAGVGSTAAGARSLVVVRLNPNGTLDDAAGTGFDGDGIATFATPTAATTVQDGTAVVIQPGGAIAVATTTQTVAGQGDDFLVVRFSATGAVLGSEQIDFGLGGTNNDRVEGMTLDALGRLVVVGSAARAGTDTDFAVARLNANGTVDTTFGTNGKATVAFNLGGTNGDGATGVVVRPDGRIVVTGTAGTATGNVFAAAQLLATGGPDTAGFGTQGKTTVEFAPLGRPNAQAFDAGLDGDGRVVIAGFAERVAAGTDPGLAPAMAAVRLTPSGALDSTFDGDGRAVVSFTAFDQARAVVIEPDRDVVLVGGSAPTAGLAFGLARLVGVDPAQSPPPPPVQSPPPPPPPPPPPAPVRSAPQPVLVGGRPDGTVVPLVPTSEGYQFGPTVAVFPGTAIPVRTAMADVTGDGVADMVAGAGPGGPIVVILDGATGGEVARFFAFEPSFTGGVFVAAADLDGDGKAEILVTPDQGGGPVVAVFNGDGSERLRFLGIADPTFRGGARVAAGDVNADGTPDLVVSAGFLGGPRVAVFDGRDVAAGNGNPGRLLPDFFAFEDTLRNGSFVAAGDLDGDGFADLAFGGGPGGAPRVRVFGGRQLLAASGFSTLDEVADRAQLNNFFAGDSGLRGGVRPDFSHADADNRQDLFVGSGEGELSRVRLYRSSTLTASASPGTPDREFDPFGGVAPNGVFIG